MKISIQQGFQKIIKLLKAHVPQLLDVILAKARIHNHINPVKTRWIPACAGMTANVIALFLSLILSTACDLIEHREFHDPSLKLKSEDYKDITKAPIEPNIKPPSFTPKPKPQAQKPQLTPQMKKPVSLTLQENIPLKEVLLELSHQSGVGMAISPEINKVARGVIYSAQSQPFIEVVRDLCELTDLRFQITGNMIKIEPDEPYLVTYDLHTLSQVRKNDNKTSISTDVFAIIQENSHMPENGSESVLTGNVLSDFWSELQQNLRV